MAPVGRPRGGGEAFPEGSIAAASLPPSPGDAKAPRLLDQVRAKVRRLGLARRTEEAYIGWIRRFVLASGKRHPSAMGAFEGGYTNVETRAFREAGEMAGINFAFLSTLDRPHTDSEVLEAMR